MRAAKRKPIRAGSPSIDGFKEWKVERLVDALKLSRASGIPVEKFAGEIIDVRNGPRK